MRIAIDAVKTLGKLRKNLQLSLLVPLLFHLVITGSGVNDSIGFKRISISFLQGTLAFFCAVASRLDVAGVCHSSGHAEARQHPSHQHDVGREKRDKPQPVRHKVDLLSSVTSKTLTQLNSGKE